MVAGRGGAPTGLGRDAFVLACLGCRVRMFERHPVVAALLEDGLRRAYADPELGPWLATRLTLHHGSSLSALAQLHSAPDVVYLDPMFPHRQKSALVKKEMRVFQLLVGADEDADGLLAPALALRRVVVKRPDYAPRLAGVGRRRLRLAPKTTVLIFTRHRCMRQGGTAEGERRRGNSATSKNIPATHWVPGLYARISLSAPAAGPG